MVGIETRCSGHYGCVDPAYGDRFFGHQSQLDRNAALSRFEPGSLSKTGAFSARLSRSHCSRMEDVRNRRWRGPVEQLQELLDDRLRSVAVLDRQELLRPFDER